MKIEQLNGLVKQQQPPGHHRSSSRELLQIVDKLKADKQVGPQSSPALPSSA